MHQTIALTKANRADFAYGVDLIDYFLLESGLEFNDYEHRALFYHHERLDLARLGFGSVELGKADRRSK